MLMSARLMTGALFLLSASTLHAADLYEPPVVEIPPPVVYEQVAHGAWYIRGDIDYHWSKFKGSDYITYGCCTPDPGTGSLDGDLDGAWSFGGGVGYQATRYLRVDTTIDYWAKSDFEGTTIGTCGGTTCTSVDQTSYSAILLMANAYADLGTYYGVTPYVGAGIGGAHLKWDDLRNTVGGGTITHKGAKDWRFAWSLMAGASYCLTSNLQADVGYRFTHIEGGGMFEEFTPGGVSIGVGPGFDRGIDAHEVKAGLRWTFGGGNPNCAAPQQVAYEPEPIMPVYK